MFPALSHPLPPAEKRAPPRKPVRFFTQSRKKLRPAVPCKSENHVGEIFVELGRPGSPPEFAGIEEDRLQIEMPFTDEDRAGYNSVHGIQERQRPLLKLKGPNIPTRREIVEAKRLPQTHVTELPVDRIGIDERQSLPSNRDRNLLLGDSEREFELDGSLHLYRLHERFEPVPRHPHRIRPGLQVPEK